MVERCPEEPLIYSTYCYYNYTHDYTAERVGIAAGVNDATFKYGYVSYVSITTTNYAL